MKKKKFTFDIVHRDSFPRQILIRYATKSDSKGDTFNSLLETRQAVNHSLSIDVFVSSDILNDMQD